MTGGITLDFPYDGVYRGIYKERQYGSAQALRPTPSIEAVDKARRHEQFMRNFTFLMRPMSHSCSCLNRLAGVRQRTWACTPRR